MKSNLLFYNIPAHSDAWYRFRSTGLTKSDVQELGCQPYEGGIGGSEIGTYLGKNEKYDSPIWSFHQKTGQLPIEHVDNKYMFWGRKQEDTVAEIWSYHDGTEEGYIRNYTSGNVIRKCRNVNGYIVNPDYPWLFASVDRLINKKGSVNLITGEILDKEGILECKNMSTFSYKSWEDGVPDSFICQIHQYMLILELDYAEIAILVGGNQFEVIPIARNENIIQDIIEISKYWWYNKILPARKAYQNKIVAEINGDMKEVEKYEAIIQSLEPEPDSSDAYKDYMNEKHEKEQDKMEGDMDHYELAKQDMMLLKLGSKLDSKRKLIQNQVRKILVDNKVGRIDFEDMGYVGINEKKTWANKIEEEPGEEVVDKIINSINLRY